MAVLTSADESVLKKKFDLAKDPVVIGRHPACEIHIDDGSVSRRHAQIIYEHGEYYLEDLESRNGTFLNDEPVNQRMKLFEDSEIRICDVSLIFHSTEPDTGIQRPRPTLTRDSSDSFKTSSSVFLDDQLQTSESKVMSKLEVPSHHSDTYNRVGAEEKLAALTRITFALSEAVEQEEILEGTLDCLFELFTEADRGFIILRNADGRLVPQGFKARRPSDDEQVRISRTIVEQVLESRQPVLSSDAASDERFDMAQSIVDFRIRSIMCAPLINSKDEAIGVIQLDTFRQKLAFSKEDLETLTTVAMQASLAIQKSDLFEDVKKTSGLRNDLALAHELQQRFLPQTAPGLQNYKFFSYYRPMQQVGGDYFDYIPLGKDRLGIVVADVVGHGIAAALLMAKVSAESRFALATSRTALSAISKMNNGLSGLNIDRFVTLALALVDLKENKMTLVNAGHMPPIIRHANGDIEQLAVEQAGLPLGILEDFEYESVVVEFKPGDVLIMYTDGINEAMNSKGQQLTTDSMIREIKLSQFKTPETIGNLLCETVAKHIGRTPVIDDMCLVCISRTS